MLRPPVDRTGQPFRERILLYGSTKSGKTSCGLSIAWWAQKTSSPTIFHWIDTDNTLQKSMTGKYEGLENVVAYPAGNWEELRDAARIVREKAVVGDWIVMDMVTDFWQYPQQFYGKVVHGLEDEVAVAEERLRRRMEWEQVGNKKKTQDDILQGYDWQFVKGLYYAVVKPFLFKSQAHILALAQADDMDQERERDKQKRLTFGKVGAKAVTEKTLPYSVDTLLYLDVKGETRRLTHVLPDRMHGREMVERLEVKEFCSGYLLKHGGWTLK